MTWTAEWLLGIAVAAGALAPGAPPARADTVTNVALKAYYDATQDQSSANGGGLIRKALEGAAAAGNAGTGLIFSDPTGKFVTVPPGKSVAIRTAPIPLNGTTVINALLNTVQGSTDGGDAVNVTFKNSLGASATFSLLTGQTIRDDSNDGGDSMLTGFNMTRCHTCAGVTSQVWWSTDDASAQNNGQPSQRLDVQTFVLPASWSDTRLKSVTISNPSGAGADVLWALQIDEEGTM